MLWVPSLKFSFSEIPASETNSRDSDQMPQNVASDLGLHCLSLPFIVL